MFRTLFLVSALGLTVSAVGCGDGGSANRPARVPVTGLVTLDGTPVSGATVLFSPVSHQHGASAVTDDAGRFELRTFEPGDGAVPGKFQVAVRKVEMLPGERVVNTEGGTGEGGDEEDDTPPPIEKFLTPEQYANAQSSGLEAEVAEGETNEFTFAL